MILLIIDRPPHRHLTGQRPEGPLLPARRNKSSVDCQPSAPSRPDRDIPDQRQRDVMCDSLSASLSTESYTCISIGFPSYCTVQLYGLQWRLSPLHQAGGSQLRLSTYLIRLDVSVRARGQMRTDRPGNEDDRRVSRELHRLRLVPIRVAVLRSGSAIQLLPDGGQHGFSAEGGSGAGDNERPGHFKGNSAALFPYSVQRQQLPQAVCATTHPFSNIPFLSISPCRALLCFQLSTRSRRMLSVIPRVVKILGSIYGQLPTAFIFRCKLAQRFGRENVSDCIPQRGG